MASYGKFVTDNAGRGRSSDEQRFLDMHRDVIEEQYDVERAGKDARRAMDRTMDGARSGWKWVTSLPPIVMVVTLCLIVLTVVLTIPFIIVAIARLMSNFLLMRRFIVVVCIGALAGTCMFALVFLILLGIL